jgi:hypothetical protein
LLPPISGLNGTDLQSAVAQGGRFVIFQYCVSILVMTFKRSSSIYFIKSGESAASKGAPFCLISLVAGWWGIPWGPIWTLTTVATNLSGGKDVTRQILAAAGLSMPAPAASPSPSLSPVEVAAREESKSLIMKLAWAAAALLVLGIAFVAYKVISAAQK